MPRAGGPTGRRDSGTEEIHRLPRRTRPIVARRVPLPNRTGEAPAAAPRLFPACDGTTPSVRDFR